MDEYGSETYGDRGADIYDRWHADLDPTDAVDRLTELAGCGPILELGIGTGRIAVPLAERGWEVHGIDASEAMLAKLREKASADAIQVQAGALPAIGLTGPYSLIFAAFNTFFALTSQEDQVRCFENVYTRLTPDGIFAIEGFLPDPARFDRGQRFAVASVDLDSVKVEATRHDAVAQTVEGHTIEISGEGTRLLPIRLRYAWPPELDLMARLAGLRLRERWGGWNREPYTAASVGHVSVYEQA